MKKFVALFEGWNDKHDHECMCYTVSANDDFESILSVEEQAEKMGKKQIPIKEIKHSVSGSHCLCGSHCRCS